MRLPCLTAYQDAYFEPSAAQALPSDYNNITKDDSRINKNIADKNRTEHSEQGAAAGPIVTMPVNPAQFFHILTHIQPHAFS